MKIVIFFLLLLNINNLSHAKPLISGLGQDKIKLDARFSGKNIFLFGVRNLAGEIVVVVRGPKQDYMVRKKEKIMGVWLNRKQMAFKDVNSVYAVYSSVSKDKLQKLILANLNIGIDNLPFIYSGKAYIAELENFRAAILAHKFNQKLYIEDFNHIKFMGNSLFKTQLSFSKHIPEGIYNVEIYLIDNDELIGVQSIPIIAEKTGIEATIHSFAHDRSLLYGILCVLAAIFAGWFASVIFWKI
jgi:uncharacterized protein (TIGR02186 family)